MLYIYPDTVEAVEKFVKKRWPMKKVLCQENPAARHDNRFILITSSFINDTVHYEYINGYLELHFEGDYRNEFNKNFYQYLRENITLDGDKFCWHNWWSMQQGRLRYESFINTEFDLAEAIILFVNKVDPIIEDYLCNRKDSIQETPTTEAEENKEESSSNPVELTTLSLKEVFGKDIRIPPYQRIYCWPRKNVELLMSDIFQDRNHSYHLGTIILQQKGTNFDIIDGQQRLVTLTLILSELGFKGTSLLNQRFEAKEAKEYVAYNKYVIQNSIKRYCREEKKAEWIEKILRYVSMDVLVLQDTTLDLAYTFFTTQNSRGKALTDYELLKSHHLRYIPEGLEAQQRHLAKRWDELLIKSERESGDKSVSIILGTYLYCLRKWSRKRYWYIKEYNRVKNEFEAAPIIPDIPPFGEQFTFMDPIQGGSHFFAFVENFCQKYHQFVKTKQYDILWHTMSCSGVMEAEVLTTEFQEGIAEHHYIEGKKRTHWWYGDVIATFLFAYYLKFGEQYLAEALTCITRVVSQLRYETSKANKQSLMDKAGDLEIILMINQATSPTFFLAEISNIIKGIVREYNFDGIRIDFLNQEKELYNQNSTYYSIAQFKKLHNNG